jgi:hypothetical protein
MIPPNRYREAVPPPKPILRSLPRRPLPRPYWALGRVPPPRRGGPPGLTA